MVTKTKFSVFLASPLSTPFYHFTSRFANIEPDIWTQIETWFDEERENSNKVWHLRISQISRFINQLLDELILTFMLNPTYLSTVKIVLNLITAANLLKSANMHKIDAFKFLINLSSDAADCETVLKLKLIIQKIAGPNFSSDELRHQCFNLIHRGGYF